MSLKAVLAVSEAPKHGSHIDFDFKSLKNCLLRSPPPDFRISCCMELLLNLAWLLLAMPAYWLWRASRTASAGRRFNSLQCLLTLSCMLVILFPVISATDDLCAMRAEVEESPTSKRTIRQSSNDKASPWKSQSPPALAATTISLFVSEEGWQQPTILCFSVPTAPAIERTGRAPPTSRS